MNNFIRWLADQSQDLGSRTGKSPDGRHAYFSFLCQGQPVTLESIPVLVHHRQEHFPGKSSLKNLNVSYFVSVSIVATLREKSAGSVTFVVKKVLSPNIAKPPPSLIHYRASIIEALNPKVVLGGVPIFRNDA